MAEHKAKDLLGKSLHPYFWAAFSTTGSDRRIVGDFLEPAERSA